jgi:hypothetical protein
MKTLQSSVFDIQLENVMKKLISLVIAAAISVSMLGCANETKTPPPTPPAVGEAKPAGESPPVTPAPEGGAAPAPEGKAP